MLKIDKEGNRFWYNKKKDFHRVDGPAIEYRDGTKCWYVNGKRHRINGPAIEWNNGEKYRYVS